MTGPLTSEELQQAELCWIKKAQKTLNSHLQRGDFICLSPFKDEKGIIRVGGRIDKAVVTNKERHPRLLPSGHRISQLIMRHMHTNGHSGVAATTARGKHWTLKANKHSKSIKSKCVACQELAHKWKMQLMTDLPLLQLSPQTPPLYYTVCNYFGPSNVRIGQNRTTKHYSVIFTCLNTRAVHMEPVVDSCTMEFMQVLWRFFSIQGYSAVMLSHNGSQMVGTVKELCKMVKGVDANQLWQYCGQKGIQWIFTTPAAPHQNGYPEVLVKSCKNALKRAIGE